MAVQRFADFAQGSQSNGAMVSRINGVRPKSLVRQHLLGIPKCAKSSEANVLVALEGAHRKALSRWRREERLPEVRKIQAERKVVKIGAQQSTNSPLLI